MISKRYFIVETEFAAVSIVLLVSFWCFDGSGGFVPVFRRFGRSGCFVSVFRVLVHAHEKSTDI